MSDMNYHFRAALHGFNREDVVAFIENASKEHEDETKRLRTANQKLKEELESARSELEEARKHTEAAQELEAVRKKLNEVEAENRNLLNQIGELEQRIGAAAESPVVQTSDETPAQPDLSEPILPVGVVVSDELSPAKDYTELELAAYRRAEMAERLAKDRAQEVYRKINSIFGTASKKLDTGKSDLDQLTETIRDNVKQMLLLLNNITSSYSDAQASFAAVNDQAVTDD